MTGYPYPTYGFPRCLFHWDLSSARPWERNICSALRGTRTSRTCKTVSPRNIISLLVSSTIRSWTMNHFSFSIPPPAARRCTFQTVFSLSLVVPATDSWVTFAIRSYNVDRLLGGTSMSARTEFCQLAIGQGDLMTCILWNLLPEEEN